MSSTLEALWSRETTEPAGLLHLSPPVQNNSHTPNASTDAGEEPVVRSTPAATSKRHLDALVATDTYLRWRPRVHLMPRQGWLNDPCAPGYDATSGIYHVGFQWNPDDTEWGNISWGAAHSQDLVTWTILSTPTLAPASSYDCAGVFTGSLRPPDADGSMDSGAMTCIYTAVNSLPIHFAKRYIRGSEAVALATSVDSGRTWTRFANNPVVSEPPPDLDVTGWRDPYVAPSPAIDRLRQQSEPGNSQTCRGRGPLYGLISGGIRNKTPTTFLYEINSADLSQWRYLGPLIEPGLNFSPCPPWAGDFGVNWEVCNLVSLSDRATGVSREFVIAGVEGRRSTTPELHEKGEFRATHAQMWLSGPLNLDGEAPRMRYQMGGVLDHGSYYAANSFWDPQTEQQVVFGWLLEDDLAPEMRKGQGWAGCLSLPRVMRLVVLHGVVGALVSKLGSIGSFHFVPEDDAPSQYTGYSLCTVPDSRLEKLRRGEVRCSAFGANDSHELPFTEPVTTWEAKITFSSKEATGRLGLRILHGNDEATDVYFEPATETVTIDRSKSTSVAGVRRCNEQAPHTLFKLASPPTSDGKAVSHGWENLELHVFYDCSVLEVFVNQRTAISTRVYPSSGTSIGVALLEQGDSSAQLVECRLWPLKTSGVCVQAP